MVAKALNTRVYMPDFFEPNEPFPASKYPPQTPENKAAIQAFFGGPAKPDVATEKLKKFAQVLKQDGAKKVGAYGFCWGKSEAMVTVVHMFIPAAGGKVAISAGGEGTPLDAVAMVHPA